MKLMRPSAAPVEEGGKDEVDDGEDEETQGKVDERRPTDSWCWDVCVDVVV